MGNSNIIRPGQAKLAIMMAGGLANRVSPSAWKRTKGLWPMVGRRMITRIITELYNPHFKDVLITTCLFADQIKGYVTTKKDLFQKKGLDVNLFIPEGKETEKFLNTVNTAHSVLLAYKRKYGIPDMCELAKFAEDKSIENLAKPEALALYQRIKSGKSSKEDKDRLADLQRRAGKALARSLEPLPEKYPPFIVTGCDALSTGDLKTMYKSFLEKKEKGVLGVIKIKTYPYEKEDLVKNYGTVSTEAVPANAGKEQFVVIKGFEEKSERPNWQEIEGKRSYLVNPQLYCFNPAVLAFVELFAKYGEPHGITPDWGRDILPILARSDKLLGDIMKDNEYWADTGDYGTFLQGAQDILHEKVPESISIPGDKKDIGWLNGGNILGDPIIQGPIYAGPGSIIHSTANIKRTIIEREAIVKGFVSDSIIFEGAEIPERARIENCIVGLGVKLPDVEIELKNVVIEVLYDKDEPIILTTEIPYERDAATGQFILDSEGKRLSANAAPGIPRRRFFPNV